MSEKEKSAILYHILIKKTNFDADYDLRKCCYASRTPPLS